MPAEMGPPGAAAEGGRLPAGKWVPHMMHLLATMEAPVTGDPT